MKTEILEAKLARRQVQGLDPVSYLNYLKVLGRLINGQKITLVNIICPGYVRRREAGTEYFDFPKLSANVLECPNVMLMVKKMNRIVETLERLNLEGQFETVMILADVAILNYYELSKRQNVTNVLNQFYKSIEISNIFRAKTKFVKMSDLGYEFKKIPISGIKISDAHLKYSNVNGSIKKKAGEYEGTLNFSRINELLSKDVDLEIDYRSLVKQTNNEVARFVAEYGLAGLAIRKLYKNPIILFTEPSGYLRGYFYNSYLSSKYYLPILYLC
jgi:hypothetical protein